MKSMHSLTAKCVDHFRPRTTRSLCYSLRRWQSNHVPSMVANSVFCGAVGSNLNNLSSSSLFQSSTDNTITHGDIASNTNPSTNIDTNNSANEASNNINPNQSSTTQSNAFSTTTTTTLQALSTNENQRIISNTNIPNHNISLNNRKCLKNQWNSHSSYLRLQNHNKRLFNVQSQSHSSNANGSDNPTNNNANDSIENDENDDGGASLRDINTIRQSLGKVLGHKVYIWGQVSGTSLGFEDNEDSALPLHLDDSDLNDGSGFRDIAVAANQTAVVTGKGDLYVFGGSKYGELGIGEDVGSGGSTFGNIAGSQFTQLTPVKVDGISNVVKVSCGARHTAAITANGELYTWGWGGGKWGFSCGGLGHGDKESINYPKKVEYKFGPTDEDNFIIDVSCGDKHTLVLTSTGNVFAMGEGEHGRLGTGHTSNSKKPIKLEYFNDMELCHIYAAKEYSFGLTSKDGIPFGWGRNDRNQMGQGGGLAMDIYSCDPTPGPINLQNVVKMDLSAADVLAITNDGTVYHWGDRIYLEPNAINSERFQDELPNGKIVDVGASSTGMFFISSEGELFSCNKTLGMRSDVFTLGHGAIQPFKIAKRVEELDGEKVVKICAADQRTAVIVE